MNNINDYVGNDNIPKEFIKLDFSANKMQGEFYQKVKDEIAYYLCQQQGIEIPERDPLRYFFYGGAIRGGKTTVCLWLMIRAAMQFPKFRGHIIRNTAPSLASTTIQSFNKFCPPDYLKRVHMSQGNTYAEFINGSRIYFFPESIASDKDLNRFKGLETNWIMLEQVEELQISTYNMCLSRVGSWYIDPMPPPIVLSTFNPTLGWLKDEIYDKHMAGELKPPYYYQAALPADNPFVTKEQWDNWGNMDAKSYNQFIKGDWEFGSDQLQFLYSFDKEKHVGPAFYTPELPLWLSFDFNVSPMTCILGQHTRDSINIIGEHRMPDTDISTFVNYVKSKLPPNAKIYVTGDPAGKNNNVGTNVNYYQLIQQSLGLASERINVLRYAPMHEDSRIHCNTLFEKLPYIQIDPSCRYLIEDLLTMKVRPDGKIDKDKKIKSKMEVNFHTIGHLLDCLRYYIHVNFPNFSTIIKS